MIENGFHFLDEDCDESQNELWKSFEDGILSPQNLCDGSVRRSLADNSSTSSNTMQSTSNISNEHSSELSTISCDTAAEISRESCDTTAELPMKSCDTAIKLPMKSCDTATEISMKSDTATEKSCDTKQQRRVHFQEHSRMCVVHKIIAWKYAYRTARKGQWEECARDRVHFARRIDKVASILEPFLVNKLTRIQSITIST